MQMRLAFAMAVHTEPEILLIDEVLSVGDIAFQHKCLDRIAQFKAPGCSILLVSHESSVIQEMCDEALWLNRGPLMAQGVAADVVRQYVDYMEGGGAQHARHEQEPAETAVVRPATVRTEGGAELVLDPQRFGTSEVELTAVRVLDCDGEARTELRAGQPLRVEIDTAPRCGWSRQSSVCASRARTASVCYVLTTEYSNLSLSAIEGTGQAVLELERLDLNSGRYVVDASCYAQDWVYVYDYQYRVASFVVRGDGTCWRRYPNSPFRWQMQTDHAAPVAGQTEPAPPTGFDSLT